MVIKQDWTPAQTDALMRDIPTVAKLRRRLKLVLDAADKMTTACSTCHDLYREKTPRCMP